MSREKDPLALGVENDQRPSCILTSFGGPFSARTSKPSSAQQSPSHSPSPEQKDEKAVQVKSVFFGPQDQPLCKILIMGDFTHTSQRKEQYIRLLNWQTFKESYAPKFYTTQYKGTRLIMNDISNSNSNSFPTDLKSSTYITFIPSSAQDLSLCCHSLYNRIQLLPSNCKLVYLNLAERDSSEYSAIEKVAMDWKTKRLNMSLEEAPSIEDLIEKAVAHTQSICQKMPTEKLAHPEDDVDKTHKKDNCCC